MSWADVCSHYNLDPTESSSNDKIQKLVAGGLIKQKKLGKSQAAKAEAAELPAGACFSYVVTRAWQDNSKGNVNSSIFTATRDLTRCFVFGGALVVYTPRFRELLPCLFRVV